MDIASLFSAAPSRASRDVRYRQGVIVSFDQNTLENVVKVGGVNLVNLPLLGMGEATTLQPGDVVGVLLIGEKNAQTWAIIGQMVAPDTPEAINAITLLNQQVFSDSVITGESTTSATYGDLATVGPEVTVNVGPSERLLIIMSAQLFISDSVADPRHGGRVVVEMSGANTLAASTVNSPVLIFLFLAFNFPAATGMTTVHNMTSQGVAENLNQGDTTITMKYRTEVSGRTVEFSRRVLTVIKL